MINSLTRACKPKPGNKNAREVVVQSMMHQVMKEEELHEFLSSLNLPISPVLTTLHYYRMTSHFLEHEGVSIEVTYNGRDKKYLVSMW